MPSIGSSPARRWLDGLSEGDLVFLKRFVLASGSLKELARIYGISYPTVRLRLDRLIEKVKVLDDPRYEGEFERTLRAQFADGRIDERTMQALATAHKKDMETRR